MLLQVMTTWHLTQRLVQLSNRQGASSHPQGDARVIGEGNKMLPTRASDWHTRMNKAWMHHDGTSLQVSSNPTLPEVFVHPWTKHPRRIENGSSLGQRQTTDAQRTVTYIDQASCRYPRSMNIRRTSRLPSIIQGEIGNLLNQAFVPFNRGQQHDENLVTSGESWWYVKKIRDTGFSAVSLNEWHPSPSYPCPVNFKWRMRGTLILKCNPSCMTPKVGWSW